MKWIVVVIVALLVPYTWLTLAYRKEGPAHRPYQDNKDRAQVLRLLNGGFNRIDLTIETLTDPLPASPRGIDTTAGPGGLPFPLRDLLIDLPAVPPAFSRVSPLEEILGGEPYVVTAVLAPADEDRRPLDATLYLREGEAVFLVGYGERPDARSPRPRPSTVRLSVPADTFVPDQYHGTLVGAQESRRWAFQVR